MYPVKYITGPSSGTNSSSFPGAVRVYAAYYPAEQAQRAGRSEQSKRVLSEKSAIQWNFDLLGTNASCHTSDTGTQFIVVDMKVSKDLVAQAKCGSCGARTRTLSKENGLAAKLLLACSSCDFLKSNSRLLELRERPQSPRSKST